jgi:hypothetical protein
MDVRRSSGLGWPAAEEYGTDAATEDGVGGAVGDAAVDGSSSDARVGARPVDGTRSGLGWPDRDAAAPDNETCH